MIAEDNATDPIGTRFAGILGAAAFAMVVLLGGGAAVFYARARFLDVAVAAAAAGAWAVVAIVRPGWRPRTEMWLGLALAVTTMVAAAILSRAPRWGLEFAAYALLLCSLYGLSVALFRNRVIRTRVLAAIPVLCASIIVAYLALVAVDWWRFWSAVGGFAIPPLRPNDQALAYSNPNAAMAVAVLLLAGSFGVIGVQGRRRLAVLGILVSGVLAVAFLSGSRAGMVGLLTGVVALTIAAVATRRGPSMTRVLRDRRVRMAALAVGMAAVLTVVLFWPVLERRLLTGGADLRLTFWRASGRMFVEDPLFGVGPGMWPLDRIRSTVHPESDVYIPHAHNIVVNTAAELGVVGLIVGVVCLLLVARVIRAGIRSEDPDRRRWGFVSVFVIGYLVGHQQLDLFANAPAVLAAGALPVAILDAGAAASRPDLRVPKAIALAALAGIVVLTPFLAWSQLQAARYESGVNAFNQRRWTEASTALEAVAQSDPSLGIHRLAAGLSQARSGALQLAASSFWSAAAADDYPIAWVNLAAVYERLGDRQAAADAAEHAFRLGPQHANVALAVADVRLAIGDRQGAVEALAASFSVPSLVSDPIWDTEIPLATIYEDAVATALAAPDAAWGLHAEVGDIAGARAALADFHGFEREVYLLYLEAVEDPSKATALFDAADENPTFHAATQLAAQTARRIGDTQGLERYRAIASSYTQFGTLYGRVARIASGPTVGVLFANDTTTFYGPFTYYRPMPQDDLVPWLPHLVWD